MSSKRKHPCANLNCKNYTTNLLYCSRSCSVTVNNSKQPKRTRVTVKVVCTNSSCDRYWYVTPDYVVPENPLCRTCNRAFEMSTLEERMKTMDACPSLSTLVEAGLKERKCERCGLEEWLGEPAALEREHVDADRFNNHLDNIKILCLQCHAQTPTWRRMKTKNTWSQRSLMYVTCSCGNAYTERWARKKHVKELGHEILATWYPWAPPT